MIEKCRKCFRCTAVYYVFRLKNLLASEKNYGDRVFRDRNTNEQMKSA